jgi:hypothetical protein
MLIEITTNWFIWHMLYIRYLNCLCFFFLSTGSEERQQNISTGCKTKWNLIHRSTWPFEIRQQFKSKPWKTTNFTEPQENEMVEHIILLSKLFDGVTVVDLRKLAFTYAERLKVAHNFCKDTKLAGRDWLEWFMRRNPEISLRRPQATSINSITAFNKE